MSGFKIEPPFPVFTDLNGEPLEDGKIFIGKANLNSETEPLSVFFDEDFNAAAAQPIRTLAGYPSRDGTPTNLFVAEAAYSIVVRNKKNELVFSSPDVTQESTLVTPIEFGAIGDGTTNDLTALDAAEDFVGDDRILDGLGLTYNLGGGVFDAALNMRNIFFANGTVRLRRRKNANWNRVHHDGIINIDGTWNSTFIDMDCFLLQLEGGDDFGTFWNYFAECIWSDLIINVNKGSVNDNYFKAMRIPAIRIVDGAGSSSTTECHMNDFEVDVSQSNAEDFGIINETTLNQGNILSSVYADAGVGIIVKGNWDVRNHNIAGNAWETTLQNHIMGGVGVNTRDEGDFLSLNVENLIRGGQWDYLNGKAIGKGIPTAMSTTLITTEQFASDATTPPSGPGPDRLVDYFGGVSSASQSFVQVDYKRTFEGRISVCGFLYSPDGDEPASVEVETDSGSFFPQPRFVAVGGGYFSYKFSSTAKTTGDGFIKFFYNTSGTVENEWYLGTIFATDMKAAPLPRLAAKSIFEGTAAWDPASIPAGSLLANQLGVFGPQLGDIITASFDKDLLFLQLTAYIANSTATQNLVLQLTNPTAGAIDLPSGTAKWNVVRDNT